MKLLDGAAEREKNQVRKWTGSQRPRQLLFWLHSLQWGPLRFHITQYYISVIKRGFFLTSSNIFIYVTHILFSLIILWLYIFFMEYNMIVFDCQWERRLEWERTGSGREGTQKQEKPGEENGREAKIKVNVTVSAKFKTEKYIYNIILHIFHWCYVYFTCLMHFQKKTTENMSVNFILNNIFFLGWQHSNSLTRVCIYACLHGCVSYSQYSSLRLLVGTVVMLDKGHVLFSWVQLATKMLLALQYTRKVEKTI